MTAIRNRCSRRPRPRFQILALRSWGSANPILTDPMASPNGPRSRRCCLAAFKGGFVLNSGCDLHKGQSALDDGKADAISFGRPFISNPDLTKRFAKGLALTPDDKATWYAGGATGYADY